MRPGGIGLIAGSLYGSNKRHWISVYFNRDVSDEMVRKLVKKSYDMVVKRLNRKERERLL